MKLEELLARHSRVVKAEATTQEIAAAVSELEPRERFFAEEWAAWASLPHARSVVEGGDNRIEGLLESIEAIAMTTRSRASYEHRRKTSTAPQSGVLRNTNTLLGPKVSTIFDPAGVGSAGTPRFETMVFGGPFDCESIRCDDEAEALANHERVVQLIDGPRALVIVRLREVGVRFIGWIEGQAKALVARE